MELPLGLGRVAHCRVGVPEAAADLHLQGPLLSRRRLLTGGAALAVTAAAGGTAWFLRSRGEDGGGAVAAPVLEWTKELPQPGMSLRAVTRSRLLCTVGADRRPR